MDISGRDVLPMVRVKRRAGQKAKKAKSAYDAEVGRRLRACRDFFQMDWLAFTRHNIDKKMSWEDVTDLPPLKQSTFSQYETGARPLPGQIAAVLAEVHGFTTDYIFRDNPEALPPRLRSWLADRS